uniref:NADH-quinone oxidoreductase subunit H n=1 Tax=candidate division WOR-3 bacterium TaxID=2052148 RepID=A0A7C4C9S9_UNCW3
MIAWERGWRLALAFVASSMVTVLIGLVLNWVDRLVSARVQWRKGPPFFQPFADILKLLLKQTVIPAGAARTTFVFAPLLGIVAMSLTAVVLLFANFNTGGSFVGDLIVLLYLFALPALAVIMGASASRNPIAGVGASREMTLYFAYELPFLLALLVPVIKVINTPGKLVADGIRLGQLVAFQQANGPFLYSISGVIAAVIVLLCIQAKLGFVPFDIAEAEQEIMSGVLVEYSGATLAAFRITRAMMFVLMPLFLITVLWGGFANWWAVLKFLAIVVLIVLIKNTNPRLRIDQALRFFWFILAPLGIIAVVLAYAGL